MSTSRRWKPLQAVFFDMDGLLVSTEETWFDVETEVLAELAASSGPAIPSWGQEHQSALVGGPLHMTADYLLRLAGSDRSRAEVGELLVDGMERRLRTGPVRWMPGAKELLGELNATGVPCGLVSASVRRLVDAVLDAVGRDSFSFTVAGDEVANTKPQPDPYLRAAVLAGVAPECCVVLEDSPTGVAAALAAGCLTIAVPSLAPVEARPRLTVLHSLSDIDVALLHELAEAASS